MPGQAQGPHPGPGGSASCTREATARGKDESKQRDLRGGIVTGPSAAQRRIGTFQPCAGTCQIDETSTAMKTKSPIFIPASWHLSTALLLALGASAQAGDILRGGGTGPAAPVRSAGGNEAGGVQAAQARANAQDALARTTQAITAVQQMQIQARALAASQHNAGAGLPNVPNGLGAGALQIAPGAATNASLWSGANLPLQATRTTSAGTTEV